LPCSASSLSSRFRWSRCSERAPAARTDTTPPTFFGRGCLGSSVRPAPSCHRHDRRGGDDYSLPPLCPRPGRCRPCWGVAGLTTLETSRFGDARKATAVIEQTRRDAHATTRRCRPGG
jgi:hypothetical protein